MEHFFWPILGGILIGLAAVLLMLFIGKIAGVSGIFWAMLSNDGAANDRLWRWLFILGLPVGAVLAHSLLDKAVPTIEQAPFRAALAGLLVGMGVKLGNGCTSGHGVCGISRFSMRSIVATLTFMLTAIATVAITG